MNNELLKDFKTKFEAMSHNEQIQLLEYADTVNSMQRYIRKLDLEECELLAEMVATKIKNREAELASLKDRNGKLTEAVSELD